MTTITPLPVYPFVQARKGFSPSQLARFHLNLSCAIEQVLALPPAKRDSPSTHTFISTYASDAAQQTLEALIWEETNPAKQPHDHRLRQRVLLLAEKVASTVPGLEFKTLLDLCVSFSSSVTRLRSILSATTQATDLSATLASDVVPAFTSLLSPSRCSGLYGLRKTARCMLSLLRPSPPALVRPFAYSRAFVVALARAYDDGLTTISRSYGGFRTVGTTHHSLDHWEKIWLETKVDMVDIFHIITTTMIRDMSTASGPALAVEADRSFGIVFELSDLAPAPDSSVGGSADAVPFLNRSLVADYQYAYDLSNMLSSALRHAPRDDARMELLDSTLRSLDAKPSTGAKDPGALKFILHSSGTATTIAQPASSHRAKAKATAPESISSPPHDADLDLQVTQVLDVFPDHSPEYIRKLLAHPSFPFRGSAERLIDALLEGTAPEEDTLGDGDMEQAHFATVVPTSDAPIERRNVFDGEVMDLSCVHIGKKAQNEGSLTGDKAETARMKEMILRLAEAISDDSDEDRGKPRALDVIDLDDDVDEVRPGTVKVLGGGDESGDDEVDPIKPETILELAYIRDPKLFERDAPTRRSESRADLKQQTGWTDEQIEGWRIMLERNPKKERILQKHEFSGNKVVDLSVAQGIVGQASHGQRGEGSGRGRVRGRGRGRGRGVSGGDAGTAKEDTARERALKEMHKSSNRKRGHDKKMAKAGPGPSA